MPRAWRKRNRESWRLQQRRCRHRCRCPSIRPPRVPYRHQVCWPKIRTFETPARRPARDAREAPGEPQRPPVEAGSKRRKNAICRRTTPRHTRDSRGCLPCPATAGAGSVPEPGTPDSNPTGEERSGRCWRSDARANRCATSLQRSRTPTPACDQRQPEVPDHRDMTQSLAKPAEGKIVMLRNQYPSADAPPRNFAQDEPSHHATKTRPADRLSGLNMPKWPDQIREIWTHLCF